MSGPSVIDTNVVLYHLADKLIDPLLISDHFVSVMTELELLSHPELTREVERELRQLLDEVRIVGLTRPIRRATVELRRRHRIKLPDAVICATALVMDAELVTNDQRLRQIEEIRTTAPKLRQ